MNIPEEAIEKAAMASVNYQARNGDSLPWDALAKFWRDYYREQARAALSAAAPYLTVMPPVSMDHSWELSPGELLNLPDGSIVIDKHGNPSRCEDGHLGRFITTEDTPFRVVYIPAKERP